MRPPARPRETRSRSTHPCHAADARCRTAGGRPRRNERGGRPASSCSSRIDMISARHTRRHARGNAECPRLVWPSRRRLGADIAAARKPMPAAAFEASARSSTHERPATVVSERTGHIGNAFPATPARGYHCRRSGARVRSGPPAGGREAAYAHEPPGIPDTARNPPLPRTSDLHEALARHCHSRDGIGNIAAARLAQVARSRLAVTVCAATVIPASPASFA